MKRLLFLSAVLLIVLGSLSESTKCLDHPYWGPEFGDPPSTTGDHPWGGDNVTGGTTQIESASKSQIVPTTGIGPVDLVFRLFLYKYVTRVPQGKVMRNAETAQPAVTSMNNTNTGSNVGNFSIAN